MNEAPCAAVSDSASTLHAGLPPPSAWVQAHLPRVDGHHLRALDLACGGGRHALMMATAGFDVTAVDRNEEALALLQSRWAALPKPLAGGGNITTHCLDLEGEAWPLAIEQFGKWDVIVVTNYLYRPHLPRIPALLAPGGLLIYETFAEGNAAYGRPASPEYLLKPGELREFAREQALAVQDFAQGYVDKPKPAITQRICARKPKD